MMLGGALLCALPAATHAQAPYPTKAIRLVLPFAGGTDVVARLLAGKMSPALGQQVIPDPRLGAGGNIAHDTVAKAAPDGYTLLMAAPPLVINPALNPKTGFDPVRDFTAIALVGAIPNVLVVHPSVPVKSMKELIALAQKNPNKLTYGSGGVGSANHLAAELMKSLTKTQILHVPYKSATVALVGAMSGEVDVVIVASSSAAPYVKDKRMRGIAVLDTKRVGYMPDVPTTAEVGLPALTAVNWYTVMGPKDLPKPIVDRLNAEAVKAMNAPDTKERLSAMGGEPASSTPEQTADFVRSEYARWSKVIKEAGIKAE